MTDLFLTVLSLSVSGSVLALFLLAIKPAVKMRLSQRWQYYIWLVVILRFLLPFSPETTLMGEVSERLSKVPVSFSEVQQQNSGINQNDDNMVIPQTDLSQSADRTKQDSKANMPAKPTYWSFLLRSLWIVWLGAALVIFTGKVTGYIKFIRWIRTEANRAADRHLLEIYQEELNTAKIRRNLPLYINTKIISPMLIGFFRPAIVLPVLKVNDDELRQIFRHELTHYKRGDSAYKWLVQITEGIHWFNPLVYRIGREINRCCELSCDESVIRHGDFDSRILYGDALIATLNTQGNRRNSGVSLTMGESAGFIKERLDVMMNFKKKSKFILCMTVLLTISFLCGFSALGVYASPDTGNISSKTNAGNSKNSKQLDTTKLSSILNSYYSYNDTEAYRLVKSKALRRFLAQWTDASIVNPVWNYDSFTRYEGKYKGLDMYYCTFTADNGKSYYIVLSYNPEDGGGLGKVRYGETAYNYDLRANLGDLAAKLSGTKVDLSTAVASRAQIADKSTGRSEEAIRITDDSGHSYIYYLGKEKGQISQDTTMKTSTVKGKTWYMVETEAQLRAIGTGNYGLNKNYLQNADIDVSSAEWIPIGTAAAPFTGVYNGNGYKIKNLTITDPDIQIIGMFGVAKNAAIYNITLENYDIRSAGRNAKNKSVSPVLVFGKGSTKSYDNTVQAKGNANTGK